MADLLFPEDHISKSNLFVDDKKNRKILRGKEFFETIRLLQLLPSNYISDIPTTTYGTIHRAIADEAAKVFLGGELIKADAAYPLTRAEYLWQILGHRLLDIDPKFFPPLKSDLQWQRFVLTLLRITLDGSKVSSLETGATLFSDFPTKVTELYRHTPPLDLNGPFEISEEFGWVYDLDLDQAIREHFTEMNYLVEGLYFIGRFLKPAHTLFQLRLLLTERINVGAGCFQTLGESGYVLARSITRRALIGPEERHGKMFGNIGGTLTGRVQVVDNSGNNFIVSGTRVAYTDQTIFQDVDGTILTEYDFTEDTKVKVVGEVVDGIYENGFPISEPTEIGAICDNEKILVEAPFHEDNRRCCDDLKKDFQVTEDVSAQIPFGDFQTFYVLKRPIVDGTGIGRIVRDPTQIVVTVNGVPVAVESIEPLLGEIVLVSPVLLGDVVVVTYWAITDPNYPIITDTPGFILDSLMFYLEVGAEKITEVDAGEKLLLKVIFDPEKAIELNKSGDELNRPGFLRDVLNGLFVSPEETLLSPIVEHTSLCDPENLTWNFRMIDLSYSSILDSRWHLELDRNETVRHKLDDFWVLDSRGKLLETEFCGPPDHHLEDLAATLHLRAGMPIIPWTQDLYNTMNRVFLHRKHRFVASLSDVLNDLDDILNDQSFLLNRGQIIKLHEFAQDLYSCITQGTDIEESGTGEGGLGSACETLPGGMSLAVTFEETLPPPADTETDFLILDFIKILGCTESDIDTKILDVEKMTFLNKAQPLNTFKAHLNAVFKKECFAIPDPTWDQNYLDSCELLDGSSLICASV